MVKVMCCQGHIIEFAPSSGFGATAITALGLAGLIDEFDVGTASVGAHIFS